MYQTVQSKNGFTIIELLVVMGILGILMTLGINAFISTRISREVFDVSANVRNLIKTAREMSLSVAGVDSTNKWPVAYEVEFGTTSSALNIYYSSGTQYVDWNVNGGIFPTSYSTLDYGNVSATLSKCNRVVFSSVNGNMFLYNGETLVSDCDVIFSASNKTRTLKLNSANKVFDIQ